MKRLLTGIACAACGWLLSAAWITNLSLREAATCAAIIGLCLAAR